MHSRIHLQIYTRTSLYQLVFQFKNRTSLKLPYIQKDEPKAKDCNTKCYFHEHMTQNKAKLLPLTTIDMHISTVLHNKLEKGRPQVKCSKEPSQRQKRPLSITNIIDRSSISCIRRACLGTTCCKMIYKLFLSEVTYISHWQLFVVYEIGQNLGYN